jgi:hypothetical protein
VVRFETTAGQTPYYTLELPAGLETSAKVETSPPTAITKTIAGDGYLRLTFPVLRSAARVLSVRVRTPLPAQPIDPWLLPEIRLPGLEAESRLLLLPRARFRVAGRSPESQPREVSIPSWFVESGLMPPQGDTLDCFEVGRSAAQLSLMPIEEDSPGDSISNSEVIYSVLADGTVHGRLTLQLAGSLGRELVLAWPETAVPVGCIIAGESRPLPVRTGETCIVALRESDSGRALTIAWRDPSVKLPIVAGELPGAIPWPRDVQVGSSLIGLHVPQDFVVRCLPPMEKAPANRVESNMQPALNEDPDSDHTRTNFPPAEPDDRSTTWPSQVRVIVSPVNASGRPFELSTSVRVINRRSLQLVLALVAAASVLLLGTRIPPLVAWIQSHDPIAWGILALVFGLVLQPAWLGFVLALVAIRAAVKSRSERAREAGLQRAPSTASFQGG